MTFEFLTAPELTGFRSDVGQMPNCHSASQKDILSTLIKVKSVTSETT